MILMHKHVFMLLFIALAMIKLARSTEDNSEGEDESKLPNIKKECLADVKEETDSKNDYSYQENKISTLKNFLNRKETKNHPENNSGKKRKLKDTTEEKTKKSNYIKYKTNKSRWTDAEDKLLEEAVKNYGENGDFKEIFNYFQTYNNSNRTKTSIQQRYYNLYQDKSNNIKYKLRWTDAEDKLLEEAVASCDGDIDFNKIYDYFRTHNNSSNRTETSIQQRYYNLYQDKPNYIKYKLRWTDAEDKLLEEAVASCGEDINLKQIYDYFQTHDNSSDRTELAIKARYYQLYSHDQKNPYDIWTNDDKELLLKAIEPKDKNWKEVAEYYNDNKKDSQSYRSETALRIKFDAFYPSKPNYITYRLSWTEAEDKILKEAVATCGGDIDFKKIYNYFQTHDNSSDRTKTAIENRYHRLYKKDQKNPHDYWTNDDKELLLKAIEAKDKNWKKSTEYYNDNKKDSQAYRTESALRAKFDALYPSDQKNPNNFWTEEDKELLLKAIKEKDKNWKKTTEYYNDNKEHSQPHRTKQALRDKFYALYPSSKTLAKEEKQTIKAEEQTEANSQKDYLLE